jgi:hypothetical protein
MSDESTGSDEHDRPLLDDVDLELDGLGREACSGRVGFGAVLSPQMMDALRKRNTLSVARRGA